VSFRVRNAEGRYRWFLSRAERVRASDGTLLYWIGVNLDIEERQQAEFYLAEGQRLAHMGSWAFNAAGFDHWSSELFAIHGLDTCAKPPTVTEYMALVHPDDREFVAHAIQTMLATRRGFDFTKRIVRLNVARILVVYLKRAGGQSQFSALLTAQADSEPDSFSELERWIAEHLKDDLRVEALAERVHMSPRNFARFYAKSRGRTPAKAVEAIRIDAARRRLEETSDRIATVAEECGFSDEEQMRSTFIRLLGIPPREYRKRFASTGS
jgi:AraC-like DNA-binding protein